jgi:hypothetical protein
MTEQKLKTLNEMRAAERWEIRSNEGVLRFKPIAESAALELYRQHFSWSKERFLELIDTGMIAFTDLESGKQYGKARVRSVYVGGGLDHNPAAAEAGAGEVAPTPGG